MTLIICESLREIGEVACVTSAWSSRGQTLNAFSVLGIPTGDTPNNRDLGTGVPKTRGYPNHCETAMSLRYIDFSKMRKVSVNLRHVSSYK